MPHKIKKIGFALTSWWMLVIGLSLPLEAVGAGSAALEVGALPLVEVGAGWAVFDVEVPLHI